MVYLQEDIFTKNFFVKYKDKNGIEKNPLVIHYGFTDNLLLAIILNWVNLWNWKQIFLPHILMPYNVFFTSDNIRKFWYDIEKIKKLWFRVKFLNTFDFWDSRNKKIIKSINNYNPYIHIKWKNNWEYIYRILWENTWRENNFSYSDKYSPMKARWLNIRNSDLSKSNFKDVYMYRSFFTWDHVENMDLSFCDFTWALMIQSYIAWNLAYSNFSNTNLTYWRLNQSNFSWVDLSNSSLYKSVLTKTNFSNVNLKNVNPPFFIDRTKWIEKAKNISDDLKNYIKEFNNLNNNLEKIKST